MKYFIALLIFSAICLIEGEDSNGSNRPDIRKQLLPANIPVDEGVVETSLYINPKHRSQLRRTRSLLPVSEHQRVKRQFDQSQIAHQNDNYGHGDIDTYTFPDGQAINFGPYGPGGNNANSQSGIALFN